jgi:hypothetical protein
VVGRPLAGFRADDVLPSHGVGKRGQRRRIRLSFAGSGAGEEGEQILPRLSGRIQLRHQGIRLTPEFGGLGTLQQMQPVVEALDLQVETAFVLQESANLAS